MGNAFDVIVIGLGVMGAAACAECARRGVSVLGIDRLAPPHDEGSSHGSTRIFRIAYFEHPDYIPLVKRARTRWMDLNHQLDADVFLPTGGLWMARPDFPLVGDTLTAARQYGLTHEVISSDEVVQRWPQFTIAPDHVGYFEQDAGTLRAEGAVRGFLELARRNGATLVLNTAAANVEATNSGVTVSTAKDSFHARRVIITAGPWTSSLVPLLASRFTVSRHVVAWSRPKRFDRLVPGQLPCWAVQRSSDSFYYGFPVLEGDHGAKIAIHGPGQPCDPRTIDRTVRPEQYQELVAALARLLPDAAGPIVHSSVCMYTNSPDGHFILDRIGDDGAIVIGAGFSGHGFKFAPVMGEALADLAIAGKTDLPIGFLSGTRFEAGLLGKQ